MIPLHGHTCYYFNVFSRRMQDLPGYFPRFSDKKYPFSLRQPFFFPENHFTAAGMCRKGLPPPLWNPLPSHAGLLILSQDKPVKYELHHWIHAKCRMTFLGQECNQCLRIFCDGLVTDHIGKVVDTVQLFCCLIQFLCNLLFQLFRHPYDTGNTAFCFHKLLGSDKVFAVSHESRSLNTAACHGSQLGEGHSQRSHACVLTVCDADTVGEWFDTTDTLEASAGCHWFFHDGVQGYVIKSTLGKLTNSLVNILILTDSLIDYFFFCDNLARSVRIQLVGSFCIQP